MTKVGRSAEQQLRVMVRRELRDAEITHAYAAEVLKISRKHMSQMMTGKALLTLEWAERITALCGHDVVVVLEPSDPWSDLVDFWPELFTGGLA